MQLFDLSVLSKRCSLDKDEKSCNPLPSSKCAKLFKNCLEFLNEQEHLVVRACAHEQVARLILKCYDELGSTIETLLLKSEPSIIDVEKISSLKLSSATSKSIIQEHSSMDNTEKEMFTLILLTEFLKKPMIHLWSFSTKHIFRRERFD
jgi:hypothetical protein